MARFKVGDIVRVTQDNADCASVRKGDTVRIDENGGRDAEGLQWYATSSVCKQHPNMWAISEHWLELDADADVGVTKKLRAEIRSLQKRLRDSERGNMRLREAANVSYAQGFARGLVMTGKLGEP